MKNKGIGWLIAIFMICATVVWCTKMVYEPNKLHCSKCGKEITVLCNQCTQERDALLLVKENQRRQQKQAEALKKQKEEAMIKRLEEGKKK